MAPILQLNTQDSNSRSHYIEFYHKTLHALTFPGNGFTIGNMIRLWGALKKIYGYSRPSGPSYVTVIIPALNEEASIGKVIKLCQRYSPNSEIIVVDDHSKDSTAAIAQKSGARVILSTKKGKGASMRDGFLVASNEIIAFLDADIQNYAEDCIERILKPLIRGEADFVKSRFERQAGRVTELVAKPLLSLLFPEALIYSQPLSGMIAGKKSFFSRIAFEDDYGVDVGILLDMIALGCRIEEVNIGKIKNKMKAWQQLEPMARDVSKAILKRAKDRKAFSLDELETAEILFDQMDLAVKESLLGLKKMLILDMDNTVLEGRYVYKAAEEFGFESKLKEIAGSGKDPATITEQIAGLLKGLNLAQLLSPLDKIPVVAGLPEVIAKLKKRGYVVGIISDSYHFAAEHVATKIGADFSIANELLFEQSTATGGVKIPEYFIKSPKSVCSHGLCKTNAMLSLSEKYNIPLGNMIAVGDSVPDICMVKNAGIGVAFCSENAVLNSVADKIITTRSFEQLLDFAA
jgi:glucosyl-3-phosphoglycerate synthase